jgi:8-oxo-dGTP pyrophosphatase MutT (NUDIX family)
MPDVVTLVASIVETSPIRRDRSMGRQCHPRAQKRREVSRPTTVSAVSATLGKAVESMSKEPIPTWFFVLVVVRRGDEFLLVQERKHGQTWYLPAGRVEPEEDFASAARRETLEESGLPVELEGIVRIEHSPRPEGRSRVRVIFVASPLDATPPKQAADEHSLRAGWFSLPEIQSLPMRGAEVLELLASVESGAPSYPLSLITVEDAPFKLVRAVERA